jgi:hypothetical protein
MRTAAAAVKFNDARDITRYVRSAVKLIARVESGVCDHGFQRGRL